MIFSNFLIIFLENGRVYKDFQKKLTLEKRENYLFVTLGFIHMSIFHEVIFIKNVTFKFIFHRFKVLK